MALAVVTNAATSENKDVLMLVGMVHTKKYYISVREKKTVLPRRGYSHRWVAYTVILYTLDSNLKLV
jgi:hypothetical protein